MRTMYLIGGVAFVGAALAYFFASKSIGEFLLFALALGGVLLDFLFWAGRREGSESSVPVEPATTSEPHRPPTPE